MDRLFSSVSTHWRIAGKGGKGSTSNLVEEVEGETKTVTKPPGSQAVDSQPQQPAPAAGDQKSKQLSVMSGGATKAGVTAKPVAVRKSSRKLSTRMDSEVLDAFKLFDRDKDGRISKSEIIDLIESLDGDPKCPQVKEIIEASEKNAKGSIDQSEFMALWIAFKAKIGEEGETEAEIKTAFKEYDLDGDGYITKDEMVEAITKMGFVSNTEEEASKCLKEMDLDGDGKVSYAEFMVKWKIT